MVSVAELEDAVIEALRGVQDPEIPLNIYDLGLIYRLDVNPGGEVSIDMTLTAPACPVAGSMPGQVKAAVEQPVTVCDSYGWWFEHGQELAELVRLPAPMRSCAQTQLGPCAWLLK